MRFVPLAAALLLSACANTPNIQTDFDPATNFSNYRTYSWVFTAVPQGMDPFLYDRVHASIDRALQARGYTRSEPGQFAVAFTLGRRDSVRVTDYGAYGGFYPGWGWGLGWAGWYPRYQTIDNVTEGTLALDFYDTQTKHPVWHADASKEIIPGHVSDKEIDESIAAVIAKFPPVLPTAKPGGEVSLPEQRK